MVENHILRVLNFNFKESFYDRFIFFYIVLENKKVEDGFIKEFC